MDIKFDIPDSLIKELKSKRVVPFIGTGVSMSIKKFPLEALRDKDGNEQKDKLGNVRYESIFPSWWEFLTKAADKLVSENKSPKADVVKSLLNDSPPDYLEAAQRAFDALGNRQWHDLLKESFEKDIDLADKDSLDLAKFIWQLGSNLLITTNVDLVLQSVNVKPHYVKILDTQKAEFAEVQRDWQPSRSTVLHLHGLIDNEANVVFTKKQYDEFYDKDKNKAKLETLRNLFTQRTILFIGFSLDDLFILRELERVNLIYEGGANSFYILVRESEKGNSSIPSYVEKIPFSEFGKPLEDLVEELANIAKGGLGDGKVNPTDDTPIPPPKSDSDRKKPFFNVQYNSKGKEFVGRVGKIEEIWNLLNQEGCASIGQAVSVRGLGGFGKTQLAVEYAHAKKGEYKNGVFWVVADESIDNQLLQIADRQGWINQYDKTVNQLDVAKAKFLQLSDCLILFDNVETYAGIKDYLPKLNSQTHILITTREPQPAFKQIDLDLLERNESRELLLKISNRNSQDETEKEYLEKILETLGDIPLAIELVGGYLAEHETVTFAKYHQYLDEVPLDQLEKEFPEGSFTNHDRSIIQTLRISEKIIKEKPLMVEILKVLAWSGSSSMGVSLLKALIEAENDFEFDNALAEAHKLRLLKQDENVERYAIHRLLAKVIRHEKPLDEQTEWREEKIWKLIYWFKIRYFDSVFVWDFQDEIEHLEKWREHCPNDLVFELCQLTVMQAYLPREIGNYKEAKRYYEEALDKYVKGTLKDEEFLSGLQNDLAIICNELGEYENAFEYLLKAHSFYLATEKVNYNKIVASLSNLGSTLINLNKFDEGLKYTKEAIKIAEQHLDKNSSQFATVYLNAGVQYGENGFALIAHKYHILSLKIFRKVYKFGHVSIADAMCNLGVSHSKLGNFNKSLRYLFKGLKMFEKLFGNEHSKLASFFHNIASTYADFGKYEEAVNYFDKALSICRNKFGERHPKTIITAASLINTFLNLRKSQKAGVLAAEFFVYVPQNHPEWKWFEEISRPYRKNKHRHKKRGR